MGFVLLSRGRKKILFQAAGGGTKVLESTCQIRGKISFDERAFLLGGKQGRESAPGGRVI